MTPDFVYANGQKIAKVNSKKPLLHLSMNYSGSGGTLMAVGAPNVSGMTMQAGDSMSFSVKAAGSVMWGTGFLQTTPQGQLIGSTTLDQNGQSTSALNLSDGAWHDESGSLSGNAGNALTTMLVAVQPGTQAGQIDVWLKDWVITHADGSVTPILTANQPTVTPVYEPVSMPALSTTPVNVAAGTGLTLDYNPVAVALPAAATYYLDDNLGTAQMELAAGGWPVWEGQFTPFGQEIIAGAMTNYLGQQPADGTNMRYKFTGKERDVESGLDYFGARYYASSMGRWMSPDWSAKEEPVPYAKLDNPQSLNLYGYVGNNPLSKADADGHCWPLCTILAGAAIGAVTSGGIELGVQLIQHGGHLGQTDWNKVGNAALGGLVTGAIVGAIGPGAGIAATAAGTALKVGVGAAAAVSGGVVEKAVNGEKVTATGVVIDAVAGASGHKVEKIAEKAFATKVVQKVLPKVVDGAKDLVQRVNDKANEKPEPKHQ